MNIDFPWKLKAIGRKSVRFWVMNRLANFLVMPLKGRIHRLKIIDFSTLSFNQKTLYRFRWVPFLPFFRRVAVLVVVIRVVVAVVVMAASHVVVSVFAPIRVSGLIPNLEVFRLVLVHFLPRNLTRMAICGCSQCVYGSLLTGSWDLQVDEGDSI